MKLSGKSKIGFAHSDDAVGFALMAEAIGSDDTDFVHGLSTQIANALSVGPEADIDALNFGLAVVQGVNPRDQVEAMLAGQMAAIQVATMRFARRLAHVDNIPQQDSAARALNQLARTYAMQMEALKRYRSAGQQTVRVEHVHVQAGGQAVVGNVAVGRGASTEPSRPHERGLSVPDISALRG